MATLFATSTRGSRVLLFVTSVILLAAISLPIATPSVARAATATLVQTINTGKGGTWGPKFSPDPSGITYWPRKNHLVVVDGEVEEMAIWAGANMFESNLTGTLANTYDLTGWNTEPVGIDVEIADNEHFFISNDGKKTIFEINIGHWTRRCVWNERRQATAVLDLGVGQYRS
jgi:hypothetical protein